MIETIGERIKRLRKEMNLTQENIHHNQAQVSLIERGTISNPDETTLRVIANGLETTLDNLIEGTSWVRPEDNSSGKEIAISPIDIIVDIDNKGNVEWSNKTYPLYNDKGERNEYCPKSGQKLIYKCDKCERQIKDKDMYCRGCGSKLLTDFALPSFWVELVPPEAWVDFGACGHAIYELSSNRLRDEEFLSNDYRVLKNKLINNYNFNCVQLFSYDAILPFLLKKKFCTKYNFMYVITSNTVQKRFISELKNKAPKYIIFNKKFEYISLIPVEKRFENVFNFIDENYRINEEILGWIIYKKK